MYAYPSIFRGFMRNELYFLYLTHKMVFKKLLHYSESSAEFNPFMMRASPVTTHFLGSKFFLVGKGFISYLSMTRLFKGHSQPADVGAGHSYGSTRHTHRTVVVVLLVHQHPGFPAVRPPVLVLSIITIINLHGAAPEPHIRIGAGGDDQVRSKAHGVDGGRTQVTCEKGINQITAKPSNLLTFSMFRMDLF